MKAVVEAVELSTLRPAQAPNALVQFVAFAFELPMLLVLVGQCVRFVVALQSPQQGLGVEPAFGLQPPR